MRTFPLTFTYANRSAEKAPRFIVAIVLDTESVYMTSHPGVPNVPGVVIEDVIQQPSAMSTRIVPDQGRSEIGTLTFSAIDRAGLLTEKFRELLADDKIGLRGKTVRFYVGFGGADWSQYQLFQTQVIAQEVTYKDGVYNFRCSDITREQRKQLFDIKTTTLTASIGAADTTIPVVSTTNFHMVEHRASWADAPNQEVGYIKIGDEIIRYDSFDASNFINCTRGALNTRAVPHEVDLSVSASSRSRVEEYVYIELPAPKLAMALMTGRLYGQAGKTLPDHWHMGIDPSWVREEDFTGIGADLWTPSSDATSFTPRFAGLKKTDGKGFIEKEVYHLIGCYATTYSDGTVGIKRMNPVLADAPAIAALDESNIVAYGELEHDMAGVSNVYRVDWNYDGQKFTRATVLVDTSSVAIHGEAPQTTLQFKGLVGSRHTDATVRARINALRDRYSHPPVRLQVNVFGAMNGLEVGDIVRVRIPQLRDFTRGGGLDRSFEIQRMATNYKTGSVSLDLFGSTGSAGEVSTSGDEQGGQGPLGANSLPDEWYDLEGTDLASVVTITDSGGVGIIAPGAWPVAGGADLTDPASIYYYLGDLELPSGSSLQISNNVQLRVMGHFQINGAIDGKARGAPGAVDDGAYGSAIDGLRGFGNARGMDGVLRVPSGSNGGLWATNPAHMTQGLFVQVPFFDLVVVMDTPPRLAGMPSELRGTSGPPGGKLQRAEKRDVYASGGAGGAGGAGLCIVSRGIDIGLSGKIDLSGGDSGMTGITHWFQENMRSGAGAGGCPGALLILLDGPGISVPDLSQSRFEAWTGTVGAPLTNTMITPAGGKRSRAWPDNKMTAEGYLDPAMTSHMDLARSAYRIQYIPTAQTAVADQPVAVPPATAITATGVPNGISIELGLPGFDLFDSVELHAAASNDRSGATMVAQFKATSFFYPLAPGITRYFWCRLRRGDLVSPWLPSGGTAGESATST